MEEIKQSQRIFYRLIEKRQITKESDKELYEAYNESENIKNLVNSQAKESECIIERFSNVIYLVPMEKNYVFGFTKTELKYALCKSNASEAEFSLAQFVIITLLVEFYDSNTQTAKSRSFIRGGELLNIIEEQLKEGVRREAENSEKIDYTLSFETLYQMYSSLKSEEKGSKMRTTKQGFVAHILNFLQKQGLIQYIETDDLIQTTEKLDHFMDWNLLNKNNYEKVLKILGGDTNE